MIAPLRIPVAELIGRPGAVRRVSGAFELPGLVLERTGTGIDPAVVVGLEIVTIVAGLSVTGSVRARWHGDCRRCLLVMGEVIDVPVSEVFEDDATEAETWPIAAEHVDLEPVIREALLLALPLSPLCRPECAGPDPDRFPTDGAREDETASSARDPRWAALEDLRFDESPSE